jgi:hypothetical protein
MLAWHDGDFNCNHSLRDSGYFQKIREVSELKFSGYFDGEMIKSKKTA